MALSSCLNYSPHQHSPPQSQHITGSSPNTTSNFDTCLIDLVLLRHVCYTGYSHYLLYFDQSRHLLFDEPWQERVGRMVFAHHFLRPEDRGCSASEAQPEDGFEERRCHNNQQYWAKSSLDRSRGHLA